jgi:F-type H+-transporting ATPase subunit b
MDPTLKALIELLLKAVPTIFFLVILTAYLKYVFFKPMERVLEQRRQETEGARKLAGEAFSAADKKAADFEKALMQAKLELHREQEAQRKRLLADQAQAVAEARSHAEARLEETRRELSAEMDRAVAELTPYAQGLATQMIENVVGRRAA